MCCYVTVHILHYLLSKFNLPFMLILWMMNIKKNTASRIPNIEKGLNSMYVLPFFLNVLGTGRRFFPCDSVPSISFFKLRKNYIISYLVGLLNEAGLSLLYTLTDILEKVLITYRSMLSLYDQASPHAAKILYVASMHWDSSTSFFVIVFSIAGPRPSHEENCFQCQLSYGGRHLTDVITQVETRSPFDYI